MVPIEKLLALLSPGLLERLALDLRVDAPNQVRLPGRAVFLCLLNTLVNSAVVTQRLLEECYGALIGGHADHSSFGKRLAKLSPAYFEAIFRSLYRRLEAACPNGERGLRVRRVDATTVTMSAKLLHFGLVQRANGRAKNQTAKRHVKTVVTLSDAGLPDLLRLCVDRSEANDNHALGASMVAATRPGDLWVFDRGCKDRDRLLALQQRESYWLTPQCGQRLRVTAEVWACPDPPEAQATAESALTVAAHADPKSPAPFRLLRVERAVFENAEDARHPTWQAKWAAMPLCVLHCVRYNRRAAAWEPFVLLTNLPLAADQQRIGSYTFAEVPELYRRRWELEVFFKFLKQHLSYAHLTSLCENGVRLLLWMSLITALLLIWYQRETGIDRGWRSVKFWLAEDLRVWTTEALASVSHAGSAPGASARPALQPRAA